MAKTSLGPIGLERFSPAVMMAIITVAFVIIRFAFSSILSASVTAIPTVLGLIMNNPKLPIWGMLLITTFTAYFAFVIPVNGAHVLLTYSTDTFELKDYQDRRPVDSGRRCPDHSVFLHLLAVDRNDVVSMRNRILSIPAISFVDLEPS